MVFWNAVSPLSWTSGWKNELFQEHFLLVNPSLWFDCAFACFLIVSYHHQRVSNHHLIDLASKYSGIVHLSIVSSQLCCLMTWKDRGREGCYGVFWKLNFQNTTAGLLFVSWHLHGIASNLQPMSTSTVSNPGTTRAHHWHCLARTEMWKSVTTPAALPAHLWRATCLTSILSPYLIPLYILHLLNLLPVMSS